MVYPLLVKIATSDIKTWKGSVVAVVVNRPEKIPIPLFKNRKNKLSYAIKQEISKIVIVALEYKIDLSRLNVMELDKSKNINEVITM